MKTQLRNILSIIVLSSLSLFSNQANAATASEGMTEAWQCHEFKNVAKNFTSFPEFTNSRVAQSIEQRHSVDQLMTLLNRIVQLKFDCASIISKNKKIYGQYKALEEQQLSLEKQITTLRDQRAQALVRIDQLIREIPQDFSEKLKKKRLKMLEKEKRKEKRRFDGHIAQLSNDLDYARENFVYATYKWAPFRDQLEQLKIVEAELLKSIERLNNQLAIGDTHGDKIVQFFQSQLFKVDGSYQNTCLPLEEELNSYLRNIDVPRI